MTSPALGQDVSAIDGRLVPVPPEVVSRDSEGRVTARAVRLTESLVIDGLLRDPIYNQVPAISDFVQQEPNEGVPATERTEVRLLLSRDTLYIGVICFDSDPAQIVFTQSRRDADLNDTDSIQVVLDTFNDNQNGFVFGTNPAGLEYDGQVAGEGLTGGFQRNAGGQGSQRGQISGFNPNWEPKRVWILSYEEKLHNVTVKGAAKSDEDVAEFLKRLKQSAFFSDVYWKQTTPLFDNKLNVAYVTFDVTCKVNY